MKRSRSLLCAALAALIALVSFAGCGSDGERTQYAHYEEVLETLTLSVKVLDTESYLKCFSRGAKEAYKASKKYDEELCKRIAENDGQKQLALTYIVNDHKELDTEAIAKMKAEYTQRYAKRINISKAYELDTEFSSGDKTVKKTLTVFNDGNEWKIYGDVIESIFEER
jgi:hypothetical protein